MKIGDIVALYAKGYTKEQIGEIKTIYGSDPTVLDAAKTSKSYEELKGIIELAADTAQEKPQEDLGKDADTPPESEADKPKSEELDTLKKDKAELEQKLKAAQDANASRDNSGGKTIEEKAADTLLDIFKSL